MPAPSYRRGRNRPNPPPPYDTPEPPILREIGADPYNAPTDAPQSDTGAPTGIRGDATPMPVSEQQFQRRIVALAQAHGWLVYHTHDSRRSEPGFADLVMARPNRGIIFAELKSQDGSVKPAQARWLAALGLASQKSASVTTAL